MASWLAYRVFDSIRHYNLATVLPFGSSEAHPGISNSQSDLPSVSPPTLQLPRLYPIYPADGSKGDTTVDIIAVHGIETTSPKTWIAYEHDTEPKGRPFHWLKDADMLPLVAKGARIWAFDYNSNYSHGAQTVRVDGLATTLLSCIQDRYEDFKSRNFIFIGSCFGGIVVAEALLTASRKAVHKKLVFDQTAGVIFLGSPLRGTKAATFAGWKNFVFGILGPSHESSCTLLDDLKVNSSRLETLVAEFGKLTVQSRMQAGMEIRCFYETRKTQVFNSISRSSIIKPEEILLVDKVSACLDCHEHIPLDVRHAMMNKYRGPEDPNFKLVSGRIKDVMDRIRTNRSLTLEGQECMRTLSFPYQDQKDVNPERVDGTCEWLLQHPKFLAWRQETTANLLWVTAGPGCGKSVLSKALVDQGLLHAENPDTKTTSVCYFFFKDDQERGSGVNALCSILHQLFKQKPWLIQHALPDYRINGSKLPFGTLWDILIKAVTDTNAGPVICVFDALDECEPSRRKSLIKHISSFHRASNTTSSKLKFILTSRPYHELQMDFDVDDLPSIHLEGNEVSERIGKEVDLVISSEVSRISNIRQPPLDQKIQASLIQHLQKQNNRTYLWVYLMLQEISRSLESTERKLAQLVKAIPHSVDEAYEKILKRATDPTQAKRVLHLVLAAERPLTWEEMNIALEMLDMKEKGENCTSECDLELDERKAFEKKIENLCGLFVSVVDGRIYLIHQTAKEFLINNSGSTNPWRLSCWKHTFTPEASHLEALIACMWYLQLKFRGSPLDPLNIPPFPQITEDHPLLLYASEYWTVHFQKAQKNANKRLGEIALRLCDTASQSFLLWFNVLKGVSPGRGDMTEGASNLAFTCYFGLTSAVQLLLETGKVDVEFKDTNYGQTPLSWAAERGHGAVVKLLLETGKVDVDSKDNYGRTPLLWAAKSGHEAVVKLLLETGKVDVNSKDTTHGQTPLLWAAKRGHEAVVKLLLETGKVDVNSKDTTYGQTPLLWAAEEGHEAVVKLLLETGKVDVNSKDTTYGRTPLLWAAKSGHEAVVKLLLETGKVDVNSKDTTHGRTPLLWAAKRGHEAVVKLLLETGKVDVNSKDTTYGQTPLLWAAEEGHEAVVKLLLETGKVDVDSKDNYGRTPLLWAAEEGHEAVVKLLLETGKVDVNSKDTTHGRTPLSWAAERGHEAVVKLLQLHI